MRINRFLQGKFFLTLVLFFALYPATLSQIQPDEKNQLIAPLPDPLTGSGGGAIENPEQWESGRRGEVLELFREHVYGRVPDMDLDQVHRVKYLDMNALGGTAVMKEVEVQVSSGGESLEFSILIYLPKGRSGPVPLFLGLNVYGNHTIHPDPSISLTGSWLPDNQDFNITKNRATEESRGVRAHRWPVEVILSRGYGLATVYSGDIDPDFDDGFRNGVHRLAGGVEERTSSSWGTIAAWAWGLSRSMDYFEKDPDIDAGRVAVIGQSRLGKAALWAGAQDERFAMVISNNSGCGGAALSMRAHGETVSRINEMFPHWFARNFSKYNENEAALPVDQHMLMALVAPRPLYVASAVEDDWADPYGEYLSLFYGSRVYGLYGEEVMENNDLPPVDKPQHTGKLGYHIRTGKHDLTLYDWEQYLDFADRHLKRCNSSGNKEKARPNFVWIVSEDNSMHYMELFDPHGIATPHIEKMAGHGILFTRAFSNAPVCSVARSTLISSCYAPRTGTQFHRKSRKVPMPPGVEMFPAYLGEAGYYTTNNSKEDYNYVKPEGVWDESSVKAHWSNREPGQPFFHMESHPVSHESRLHFPAELMDTYTPVTDPERVFLFPNHPDTELFRFTGAYYRDKILAVDTIVGNVLAQLKKEGLLESTFVFYFADHGGVLPGSKGYAYETGLHIPLVVRIPENFRHMVNFRPGSETGGFVSFVDFGPTLLELAGIGIPEGVDGVPFLGSEVSSREMDQREVAFGYADRFDEKYDLVRCARKGRFKYLRNYQPFNFDGLQNNYRYQCLAYRQWRDLYRAGELDEVQSRFFEAREPEELYDLENDPYETMNLAGDPDFREQLAEMRKLLTGWVREMPDLSFYPESVLRANAFENPVEFGQDRKVHIGELVDVADLSLLSFGQAEEGIREALASGDPAKIYWGLIVCSSFGDQAGGFVSVARTLCSHQDLMVRTRAAEFLGLTGAMDPAPVILEALQETTDAVEALLILNTLVLLMDGPRACEFDMGGMELSSKVLEYDEVQRRLNYLQSRANPSEKL